MGRFRNHKILISVGLITSVVLLALIGAGSLYLVRRPMPEVVQPTNTGTPSSTPPATETNGPIIPEGAVAIATTKGSVIYAFSSSTDAANPGQALFNETILAWDPATNAEYGLVQFKNVHSWSTVQLVGARLYYIEDEAIKMIDLATGEQAELWKGASNFLITGDRLWYVASDSNSQPTMLGTIDLSTRKQVDIVSDLQTQLGKDSLPGGLAVRSYNSTQHSLTLVSEYGDAGCGSVQLFSLNLDTKQIIKTDSAEYCACDQETGNGCPADTQAEARFNELAGTHPVCQGAQVSYDDGGNLVFAKGETKKVAGSARYVGCVE